MLPHGSETLPTIIDAMPIGVWPKSLLADTDLLSFGIVWKRMPIAIRRLFFYAETDATKQLADLVATVSRLHDDDMRGPTQLAWSQLFWTRFWNIVCHERDAAAATTLAKRVLLAVTKQEQFNDIAIGAFSAGANAAAALKELAGTLRWTTPPSVGVQPVPGLDTVDLDAGGSVHLQVLTDFAWGYKDSSARHSVSRLGKSVDGNVRMRIDAFNMLRVDRLARLQTLLVSKRTEKHHICEQGCNYAIPLQDGDIVVMLEAPAREILMQKTTLFLGELTLLHGVSLQEKMAVLMLLGGEFAFLAVVLADSGASGTPVRMDLSGKQK